ncbi:hypothetical protein EAF04_008146 [Stromatinia cepivora]|nr:hypothetical protein EAF04_008146 [Stromatinia cepivora]
MMQQLSLCLFSIQVARCRDVTVPVLLHMNQETREYAMGHYAVIITDPIRDQPVYYDLDQDILHIQGMETAFVLLDRVRTFTSTNFPSVKGGEVTAAMKQVGNLAIYRGSRPDPFRYRPGCNAHGEYLSALLEFTNTGYQQNVYLTVDQKESHYCHCEQSRHSLHGVPTAKNIFGLFRDMSGAKE